MVAKPEIIAALDESRRRTLALLAPVPDAVQREQVSDLMSPLCWDLAHIGHYEELWCVRELTGAPPTVERFDDVYDAFKHPRRERPTLPILDACGAREFDAAVRDRTLVVLDQVDLDVDDPLLTDGFVYGMVVQHEHQHDETLLATLQLMDDFVHPAADGVLPATSPVPTPSVRVLPPDVLVPAGTYEIGTDTDPWAYDNERPAHPVTLAAYRIDTTPVTNRAYARFVDDGGYDDRAHWSDAGWAWRTSGKLVAPQFWQRDADGTWWRRRFGRAETVPPDEPVQHVCWHEADAFARWCGARLPTEAEWEVAAQGSSLATANLWREGPHRFAPSPVGSRPGDVSTWGAHGMLGGVWEWTASDFLPYPRFRAFPYREYSEVFFGSEYKVLRGGSWATHPSAVRTTFRNWDFPIRRQIFAGFRSRATRESLMCRHLAYVGPPVALAHLLFDAPHSLAHQAECPRRQISGDTNPDGWGVAWYREACAVPDWYRTVTPVWADAAFAARSAELCSGAFLAAARLASPGAALVDTGNAPFVSGVWSFSLNGIVHGFPDGIGDELRARVRPDRLATVLGDADTEVLFALVLQLLDDGTAPDRALARVVHDVLGLTTGRLNLLLTDGANVYGTRVGNSLAHLGAVLASEPIDDDRAWTDIPDHSVVVLGTDGAEVTPL